MTFPAKAFLDAAGLNRQHVFNLADLPADLVAPLAPAAHERQLILFGHAGRRLWECVQAEGIRSAHPIDEYSVRTVAHWLAQALPTAQTRRLYPGTQPIGLQRLGAIAGWHHAAPFMVGIDPVWGSWFAYRVAILADTDLPASAPLVTPASLRKLQRQALHQRLPGECTGGGSLQSGGLQCRAAGGGFGLRAGLHSAPCLPGGRGTSLRGKPDPPQRGGFAGLHPRASFRQAWRLSGPAPHAARNARRAEEPRPA